MHEQGRHRGVHAAGKAQSTRSSPTVARIFSTDDSTNDAAFQSRRQPQMSRKFASTVMPPWLCFTSGWNRIPKSRRVPSAMAATGFVLLEPVTSKPGGGFSIESPWLIQTFAGDANSCRSGEWSRVSKKAWPYSRRPARFTSPPRTWLMSCMP
jgi:hypothetical protein